ncbi:MAG: CoA transferase [Pseudomonadota bacterium]
MTSQPNSDALSGIRVVELATGVGGAWCGKLFADLGAEVTLIPPVGGDPLASRREDPGNADTEGLLHAWLNSGKAEATPANAPIAEADVLLIGEDAGDPPTSHPKLATIDINWFGRTGPYAHWRGSDIAAQALAGMTWPIGPIEGPPDFPGDVQAAMVGGVTGFIAGVAALVSPELGHRHFEISTLEAIMVMGELQIADAEFYGRPCPRDGRNRFSPTCPVGIHKCKEGWLGVTVITPAQWASFCDLLDLSDMAQDPGMGTIQGRSERVDDLERAIDARLLTRTAHEWAALGRQHKVPLVIVPDAQGILDHPVFRERGSLEQVPAGARTVWAPRSPIKVSAPTGTGKSSQHDPQPMAPLNGIRIADFSMGWAGPLATRLMADLGAEVIKIEAGRYPDWWRATNWDPDEIARKQYEESRRFAALNRGKQSISLDLTSDRGLDLARRFVGACDVVVENQAAGVMNRLGLGYEKLGSGRDDLIMLSMSAFGSGNVWSDTRAYGSTLEQGSGLPSFCGAPGGAPTMAHIAYGDPIGGIYGAASILAALYHRRQTGSGQWINLSQIECVLAFAAPGILAHSAGGTPTKPGMRHAEMAPHGFYPCAGDRNWVAIAVDSDDAWSALIDVLNLASLASLHTATARRSAADQIDAAIAAVTRDRDAAETAAMLQAAGVIAAPVLDPQASHRDPHLETRDFFHDTHRAYVDAQRQAGIAITQDGARYPLYGSAPFLGGESERVLTGLLGVSETDYTALLDKGVVSLSPTALRA